MTAPTSTDLLEQVITALAVAVHDEPTLTLILDDLGRAVCQVQWDDAQLRDFDLTAEQVRADRDDALAEIMKRLPASVTG
jgi:hypothetical protein